MKSNLFMIIVLIFLMTTSFVSAAPKQPSFNVDWKTQIEAFEGISPTLKKEDKKLYNKIMEVIQEPKVAISVIEASNSEERSPVFDFLLGNLRLGEGDLVNAEEALLLSLKKYPRFKKAYHSLANVYLSKSDHSKALKYALKVIELGGSISAQLYSIIAYSHYSQEHYSSALTAYRNARLYNSKHASYRWGELYCLSQLGEHKEVISLVNELMKDQKEDAKLLSLQANAYLALGEPLKAMTNLELLYFKKLADKQSLLLLSQLYFNEKIYLNSVDVLKEALGKGADLKDVMETLEALIHYNLIKEARDLSSEIEKKILMDKRNENERWLFASAQLDLTGDEPELAVESLKRLLDKNPLHASGIMQLARYFNKRNNRDEARFYFERAAYLEKVQFEAWQELGRLCWLEGDVEASIGWFEKVYKVKPSASLQETLGKMRQKLALAQ